MYKKDTPQYKSILPDGRKPFQQGSQDNRIQAVEDLINNIGADAALATLKADIQTFFTPLNAAQGTKKGKFGVTKTKSEEVEIARVAAAVAMWKNMFDIASHNYQNIALAVPFFNWEVLRPGEQKVFLVTVKAGITRFIAKRTLLADTQITLQNTGVVAIEVFSAANKTDTSGSSSVTVDAGDTKTVAASLLGNSAEQPYIIAKNNDPHTNGHLKITIG